MSTAEDRFSLYPRDEDGNPAKPAFIDSNNDSALQALEEAARRERQSLSDHEKRNAVMETVRNLQKQFDHILSTDMEAVLQRIPGAHDRLSIELSAYGEDEDDSDSAGIPMISADELAREMSDDPAIFDAVMYHAEQYGDDIEVTSSFKEKILQKVVRILRERQSKL
jgi:hypothetical protein